MQRTVGRGFEGHQCSARAEQRPSRRFCRCIRKDIWSLSVSIAWYKKLIDR